MACLLRLFIAYGLSEEKSPVSNMNTFTCTTPDQVHNVPLTTSAKHLAIIGIVKANPSVYVTNIYCVNPMQK